MTAGFGHHLGFKYWAVIAIPSASRARASSRAHAFFDDGPDERLFRFRFSLTRPPLRFPPASVVCPVREQGLRRRQAWSRLCRTVLRGRATGYPPGSRSLIDWGLVFYFITKPNVFRSIDWCSPLLSGLPPVNFRPLPSLATTPLSRPLCLAAYLSRSIKAVFLPAGQQVLRVHAQT